MELHFIIHGNIFVGKQIVKLISTVYSTNDIFS